MTVPLHLLNQVDASRCEWLVPGMLAAKVELLLKSLPQRYRRHLLPLAQTASDFVGRPGSGAIRLRHRPGPCSTALVDFLRRGGRSRCGRRISGPKPCRCTWSMNFQVVDEHGRFLAMSRQLPQLKAELGAKAAVEFPGCLREDRQQRGRAPRRCRVRPAPANAQARRAGRSSGRRRRCRDACRGGAAIDHLDFRRTAGTAGTVDRRAAKASSVSRHWWIGAMRSN